MQITLKGYEQKERPSLRRTAFFLLFAARLAAGRRRFSLAVES
jgi:hypothetical protein